MGGVDKISADLGPSLIEYLRVIEGRAGARDCCGTRLMDPATLFKHKRFDVYAYKDVPLNRDIYLMSDVWIEPYAASMTRLFEGAREDPVGYIGYATARQITDDAIELSWYPNVTDRFHEMRVSLPRAQFVACVGSWQHDEKPHLFVRHDWLSNLYLRSNSVFVLIDAIGVKSAIRSGHLDRATLVHLREGIDAIAANNPQVSFITFADLLLLKSNWQVGTFESDITYTYEPEQLIGLIVEIRDLYRAVVGLDVYAILAQGSNLYDDPLLHISATRNHVSLNSLGLPFGQLLSIDTAVREAIRKGIHKPSEIYMDETFFRSLRYRQSFKRDETPRSGYREPMLGGLGTYYMADVALILANLEPTTVGG